MRYQLIPIHNSDVKQVKLIYESLCKVIKFAYFHKTRNYGRKIFKLTIMNQAGIPYLSTEYVFMGKKFCSNFEFLRFD